MQFQGLIGVVVLIAIAYALSTDRRAINWRIVAAGILLQAVLAFLLLRFEPVVQLFDIFAAIITKVISFADEGTRFIFGRVAEDTLPDGSPAPWGFIFAVRVLPIIIFFCSLMTVLYHLGVMQRVVAAVAWVLRRTLGITGAEALSAAANIFLGQTEAPLVVKPYIAGMTRSQIMAIMTGGFATIAGSVMAVYIGMLGRAYAQVLGVAPDQGQVLFAKHLLTASVMSAPAGLLMAKIMLPETGAPRPETVHALMADERPTRNIMDAAAAGAGDGLRLALNVAAMLVAFVALLAMVNWPLAALCEVNTSWLPIASWREAHGIPVLKLQTILGYLLRPLAWCIGVPWNEAPTLGTLLGTGVVATEFVAYLDLAAGMKASAMSTRTAAIATYCLCGFANIPSIAIQIGGLSAMAPDRRSDLAAIAPRAMVAGALACWMTGAIASVFI
ncbi:MAG: NupC/NupG family nucleoside CNT transporter [Phycisphaerales bacterium]